MSLPGTVAVWWDVWHMNSGDGVPHGPSQPPAATPRPLRPPAPTPSPPRRPPRRGATARAREARCRRAGQPAARALLQLSNAHDMTITTHTYSSSTSISSRSSSEVAPCCPSSSSSSSSLSSPLSSHWGGGGLPLPPQEWENNEHSDFQIIRAPLSN